MGGSADPNSQHGSEREEGDGQVQIGVSDGGGVEAGAEEQRRRHDGIEGHLIAPRGSLVWCAMH